MSRARITKAHWILAVIVLVVNQTPVHAGSCPKWIERSIPGGRLKHAAVFDSARGVMVVFGGTNGKARGDTLEWDGATWSRVSESGPPPRWSHGMAYDSARGVTVVFGGCSTDTIYDSTNPGCSGLRDTWEWNGVQWLFKSNLGPPAPTSGGQHAMVYDAARGKTLLLVDSPGSCSTELWEWDGATWTHRNITQRPPVGYSIAAAYDSVRHRTVLHGGWSCDEESLSHQTWEWNGTSWSMRSTTGPQLYRHTMSFDSVRGVTVLTGGLADDPSEDTWEWNGVNWMLRSSSGPLPRENATMVFDTVRGKTVLFGGKTTGYTLEDFVWEWDGNSWQRGPATIPSFLHGSSMVFDQARGVSLMVGSRLGQTNNETWSWDGIQWTLRDNVGPQSQTKVLAYDTNRGVAVLFACDTWEWDGVSWQQKTTTGPPCRNQAAMSYDSARGVVVLFGGEFGPTDYQDTWEWDGNVWLQRASGGPAARVEHSMAYDPVRGVTVLYGGIGAVPLPPNG